VTARHPDLVFARFSQFVAGQMGLHFPPERASDLQRGIRSAASEFGFEKTADCIQWLMSAPLTRSQIEILASNLTVGETYFFREQRTFEIFEEHVLPELTRLRRGGEQRLRLWSAACCSGEEPYSIAISLRKTLPDFADWRLTILGSDINPRFLQTASKGVFTEWSFRNAPSWLREKNFAKVGNGRWEILPEIKRMVSFSHINLAEDVYPSLLNDTNAVDVIFCRNVLIYFAPEQVKRVIQNFYRCLTEGGWLVLSPSETAHVLFPQFVPVNFAGAILYQKDSTRTRPVDVRAPQLEAATPVFFQSPPELVSETGAAGPQVRESLALAESKTVEPPPGAYDRALALYAQGRYAETAETVAALLSSQPVEPRAMALMARALANQGNLAGALGWCDKVIAADKLNPGAHYLRASVLHEQGNLDETVHAFKRALYLDPDFVLAHFALGSLARNEGKFREADRHFENALALTRAQPHDEILPESEGITAGRLAEIITALMESEAAVGDGGLRDANNDVMAADG
jgi:chemotaxis protein methyltransferase CheR